MRVCVETVSNVLREHLAGKCFIPISTVSVFVRFQMFEQRNRTRRTSITFAAMQVGCLVVNLTL